MTKTITKLAVFGSVLLSTAQAHNFKSGIYLGPQIGVGVQHTSFDVSLQNSLLANAYDEKKSKNKANMIYGGTLGYRHVMHNFVIGGQVDVDVNNKKVKSAFNFSPIFDRIVYQQFKRKYSITPTLVLGHVMHANWMVFTQIGAVFTEAELKSAYPAGPTSHKKRKNLIGFTAGLGTEYALNKMWSLKGSINYETFKAFRTQFTNVLTPTASDLQTNRVEHSVASLKVAAVYKF